MAERARFCTECGEALPAGAKFCAGCGSRVAVADPEPPPSAPPEDSAPSAAPPEEPPAAVEPQPVEVEAPAARVEPEAPAARDEPESPPSPDEPAEPEPAAPQPSVRDRVERVAPGAEELAGRVAAGLKTPSVAAACIAGGVAAGAVLLFGFIVAALFPDDSIIGSIGFEGSLVEEAFRQAVGTLLIPFGDPGVRVAPTLFVLVPVGAMAAATAWQSARMPERTPRARLLSGLAAAVPFMLLMIVFALVSGDAEPQLGAAFLAALFWGALGGAIGVTAIGVPARAAEALTVGRAALRPLALAFLATTAIGTGIWIAQTLRDPAPARGDRSPALALAENSLYAVEHGVNFLALGTLSAFDSGSGQVAIPVDSRDDVFDESDPGSIRIFSYRDAITAPLYIPLLLVLIVIPVGAALLAGFSVARLREAATPLQAIAWGALVGPVWAVVGTLVASIAAREVIFGAVQGGSLFGFLLVGGAVLGGVGGFLALTRATAPEPITA